MAATIPITWSPNALNDIQAFTEADFGGTNPKVFHENKVNEHYANNKPALATAVQAKIRRGAHTGGTDPNEAEHITVSFKDAKKKDVGGQGVHVYTGR